MKRTIAPKILMTVFASTFVLGIVPNVQAGEDKECSVATLQGGFSATATGFIAGVPIASVGRVTFDGNGNFQGTRTVSRNGAISRNLPLMGTYTVNPDCTGIATFIAGTVTQQDFVIDDNGTEVRGISVETGTVVTVVLKKQFPEHGKQE